MMCPGYSRMLIFESGGDRVGLIWKPPSSVSTCWRPCLLRKWGWLSGGKVIRIWFGDWPKMAAVSTGTEATWETAGCLWEEITEASQSKASVFIPAAKCKTILNCQHLSPGLKNLKSYPNLSVVRSAVGRGPRTQNVTCLEHHHFSALGIRARLPCGPLNLSFLMCKVERLQSWEVCDED